MDEEIKDYVKLLDVSVSDYLQKRLTKVSKYDKRLERHNKTFLNQTWQARFNLKNANTEKIFQLEFEKTEIPYVKDFLILDSGHKSEPNVFCYDLQPFLELKNQKKRFYKSLLKRSLILAPLQKSATVMKALIKIVPRYNKNVILVPEKILNQPLNEILKNYNNYCHLKINKEQVIFRLGLLKEKSEDLSKRLKKVETSLEALGLNISNIFVKPSFGAPIKLK